MVAACGEFSAFLRGPFTENWLSIVELLHLFRDNTVKMMMVISINVIVSWHKKQQGSFGVLTVLWKLERVKGEKGRTIPFMNREDRKAARHFHEKQQDLWF